MADRAGLTFRRSDLQKPADWKALADLLHDIFGIDVRLLDALGGPDPSSTAFSYYDNSGTCVANFSAFSMPLMLDGRVVEAAGFQSGAVRPGWRGKGLYRDLMRRAFQWADEQGFELGLLLTDRPELYEPYGFVVTPQYSFAGPAPAVLPDGEKARDLCLANGQDLALIRTLLQARSPVSKAFAPMRQTEMFLLNARLDPDIRLSLLREPEVVVAWKMAEGGGFQLLDVVAAKFPTLAAITAALGLKPARIVVCFPPDRLEWEGMALPCEDDMKMMIRGLGTASSFPVRLSPMAEF